MRKFVPMEYVKRLFEVLDKQIAEADYGSLKHVRLLRDKAICCLLYCGLLRPEEIRLLTVNSFTCNPKRPNYGEFGRIKIYRARNKSCRDIPVRDVILAEALKEYMEVARPKLLEKLPAGALVPTHALLTTEAKPLSAQSIRFSVSRYTEEVGLADYDDRRLCALGLRDAGMYAKFLTTYDTGACMYLGCKSPYDTHLTPGQLCHLYLSV